MGLFSKKKKELIPSPSMQMEHEELLDSPSTNPQDYYGDLPELPKIERQTPPAPVSVQTAEPTQEEDLEAQKAALEKKIAEKKAAEERKAQEAKASASQENQYLAALQHHEARLVTIESRLFRAGL